MFSWDYKPLKTGKKPVFQRAPYNNIYMLLLTPAQPPPFSFRRMAAP